MVVNRPLASCKVWVSLNSILFCLNLCSLIVFGVLSCYPSVDDETLQYFINFDWVCRWSNQMLLIFFTSFHYTRHSELRTTSLSSYSVWDFHLTNLKSLFAPFWQSLVHVQTSTHTFQNRILAQCFYDCSFSLKTIFMCSRMHLVSGGRIRLDVTVMAIPFRDGYGFQKRI
jgi:hypothetical protein